MHTGIEMDEKTKKEFLAYAHQRKRYNDTVPGRFMETMKNNRGNAEGSCLIQKKNPVIAALGDSVTAGHFEWINEKHMQRIWKGEETQKERETIEITDVRVVYHEIFRQKLIDLYECTSVSVINAGIAGDTITGMFQRLDRDVLRYQPDLVIFNGALNWSGENGTMQEYERLLQELTERIQKESSADLILVTPNMEDVSCFSRTSNLEEKVEIIYRTAEKYGTCVADVYGVWKEFVAMGHDLKSMLANGINHPTAAGHEVYAIELMKLFQEAAALID